MYAIIAFLIGAAVMGLLMMFRMARLSLLARRYRKLANGLEAEIHQLRNLPLATEEGGPPRGSSACASPRPAPVRSPALREQILLRAQRRAAESVTRALTGGGRQVSPAVLKAAGANLVLVPDYRDRELISRLREADLWAMAVPPRPPTIDGTVVDAGTAALVPIGPESDGVLCWYLEPHSAVSAGLVTEDDIRRLGWNALTGWVDQLRVADRRMRRPIVANVVGYEHVISRQRLLPAISREVIQTGLPLKLYRQWLGERRDRVRPGALARTCNSICSGSTVIDRRTRADRIAGPGGTGGRLPGTGISDQRPSGQRSARIDRTPVDARPDQSRTRFAVPVFGDIQPGGPTAGNRRARCGPQ